MSTQNFVKDKLATHVPVLGVWSIVPSPTVSEIIGLSGIDFQILDMEHGAFDLASLEASIRSCESAGCSPLVRVAGSNPAVIQNALDLGAHGIVMPQLQDAASARAAVAATKFAPEGIRGFNPFVRAGHYQGTCSADTPKLSNSFGLNMAIVENLQAYRELDALLAIPGLDAVYLGVYDMSVAMDCMGEIKSPKILDFLKSSIPRIRKAGKAAGLMLSAREDFETYLAMGANIFLLGVDSYLIHRSVADSVALFNSVKGSR